MISPSTSLGLGFLGCMPGLTTHSYYEQGILRDVPLTYYRPHSRGYDCTPAPPGLGPTLPWVVV